MAFIPYGRQSISDDDIQAVVDVLQSDFITQGPAVHKFEDSIKSYCSVKHAIATNSATSALHIACLALEIGIGDIVWTSPITFVASANCALYCGADVDFVDIDLQTYNLSCDALEEKLITAQKINKLPKAIIVVHFAGQSCNMQCIKELSEKYNFKVIEDASHAIGGRYLEEPIGNCKYSDITIFSFHPVKIITTAEGGIATTQNSNLAEKMELLRSHGITRNPELMTQKPDGGWYYQQITLGFNYRMTDLQAALGASQMQHLDKFVSKRHELKKRYDEELQELPLILPSQSDLAYSALHLYPILLETEKTSKSHQQIFNELRHSNIGVNLHYIPVYKQPYYQKMGFDASNFPNAEYYYNRAISIPLYYELSIEEQDTVVDALQKALT